MEILTNLNGDEVVVITNEDGSIWSGLKSAYEAQAKELTESFGN